MRGVELKLNNIIDNIYYEVVRLRKNIDEIDIYGYLKSRKKPSRKRLYQRGALILAADHTARMNTEVGNNPYALLNRKELLSRIVRLLMTEYVDGVLVIPDVLDEILIANYILKERFGISLIDDKFIIASINRGGLKGSVFELDDKVTAYTPEDVKRLGLDATKVLLQLDKDNYYTSNTLTYITEVARKTLDLDIPLFIEVFPVKRVNNEYKFTGDPYELASAINVAAALGYSSVNKLLKVPYVHDFKIVAESTTLPIYLLGGGSGKAKDFVHQLNEAMNAGDNVVGAIIGRNILFPIDINPIEAVKLIKNSM